MASSEEPAVIAINGTWGNLAYAHNGLGLTIPRGAWAQYWNLPSYLIGTVTHTSINDGTNGPPVVSPMTFTTDKAVRVYATRDFPWSPVDFTGWDTVVDYNTSSSFIWYTELNSYSNMAIFSKVFPAGTHTLDNLSAMYFWKDAVIAPEQAPVNVIPFGTNTPDTIGYFDMNYNRNQRTFYSGTTWNNLRSGGTNMTFNNLTVSSDGKGIVFNGAASATEGTFTNAANPTNLLSVEMWIKPDNYTPSGWTFLAGKKPYVGGWLIFFESGGRQVRMLGVTNTGEQRLNPSVVVPADQWNHIVGTWEVGNATSGLKLYLNGNLLGTAPLAGANFTVNANPIALMGVETGQHFQGQVGSLRIYKDIVLSQREVAEGYANGLLYKYGSTTYSGRQAVVSPAVSGTTLWNFDTQGALNFGSSQENAQYVIPLGDYNVSAKIWGGGGGARLSADDSGGGGGYTTIPTLPFRKGNCYTVTVGAFGKRLPDNTTITSSNYPVGPGGGGQGPAIGFSGQGGGYSAIFTKGTNVGNVVAIAGGGGSGGVNSATNGGAGGGATAQNGVGTNSGTGATQTAAGVNGLSNPGGSVAPGRLQGGSSGSGGDSGGGGGGGGGWWGGGAGYNGDSPPGNSGGGGGSGYVPPMYTGTTTTGSGAVPANDGDANRGGSGNGARRSGNTDATDGRVYIS